jgi:glutamate-1-semialdehyde 2,1-aminomutase
MLARGFLANTSLYASVAHTPDLLDSYFENLESVFAMISKCEDGLDVQSLLKGPIVHSGFKRLN